MKTLHGWLAGMGLLVVSSICQAQDDVAILLRRVPESADAILVVRLKALLDSPRGQQENWSQKYELGYLNGAVRIPPTVKTFLMASEIQPNESLPATTYGVALLNSRKRISIPGLAIKEGGHVLTVADTPVVLTSRNSFIVELAPGFVGAMTPPNRKELARWMRFAMSDRDPIISRYLSNAMSAGRGAQIQLAVDLKDFIDPKAVEPWVKRCKKLQGTQSTFDPLVDLVKGMKGIRFTARVQDSTTGIVYLDFSKSVEDRAGYLRDLFMESLDTLGIAIDEFRNCECRTESEGRTVVLKAELADATLREIMSLIQMPSVQMYPEEATSGTIASTGSKPDLAATTRYFNAVQQLVDDLRKKVKKADDYKKTDDYKTTDDYKKTAHWHETYAKRIFELPRQGVDEEMLKYGATVSSDLDALAGSLRGVPIKVDMLEGQKYYYQPITLYNRRALWGWNYYLPTWAYADTNIPEITQKQLEAIDQGEGDRAQVWKAIDQARYTIRRRMSEKFKTDFGQSNN